MREVPWSVVKRYLREKIKDAQDELTACPLDRVERVRGRLLVCEELLSLENTPADADNQIGIAFRDPF